MTGERTNARKVDLNRNLPTKTWSSEIAKPRYHPGKSPGSEPENKALVNWIEKEKPSLIISLHSWNPMIQTNGDCMPEAKILSEALDYELKGHIGYPTPGSLGDWAAEERGIPVITYEAKKGLGIEEALKTHVLAIKKALFESEKRI